MCALLIVMCAFMGGLFDPLPMPGDPPKPTLKERFQRLFKKQKDEDRDNAPSVRITS